MFESRELWEIRVEYAQCLDRKVVPHKVFCDLFELCNLDLARAFVDALDMALAESMHRKLATFTQQTEEQVSKVGKPDTFLQEKLRQVRTQAFNASPLMVALYCTRALVALESSAPSGSDVCSVTLPFSCSYVSLDDTQREAHSVAVFSKMIEATEHAPDEVWDLKHPLAFLQLLPESRRHMSNMLKRADQRALATKARLQRLQASDLLSILEA